MRDLPLSRRVIREAVAARVAPCVVAEIGDGERVLWREAAGRLTYEPDGPAASAETVFDLASLTKVLATTPIAMKLVDDGRLDLEVRVGDVVPDWRGADRAAVTVADLLAHTSGLPAHQPLYRSCSTKEDFGRAICAEALAYRPRGASVYSDLGFILLGFLLERVAGKPLDRQFDGIREAVWDVHTTASPSGPGALPEIAFQPPARWRERMAPTGPPSAPLGVAHDENAAALSGVAGHAGLFGTAPGVGCLARAMLRAVSGGTGGPTLATRATAERFVQRVDIPGSSRALGWDTMLPSSSCGRRMSVRAFGHTGFTGTSLWIDPDAGVYVVLLTNRVHPGAANADGVTALRQAFHDAVMTEGAFSNRSG
jgi:CubicO group peptidase (beta-lactamase class C family)